MDKNTIVGSGRVKFLKPGERYHWVRETSWERGLEAAGLLPKRWAVASEPVVVETYNPDWQRDHLWEGCMTTQGYRPERTERPLGVSEIKKTGGSEG